VLHGSLKSNEANLLVVSNADYCISSSWASSSIPIEAARAQMTARGQPVGAVQQSIVNSEWISITGRQRIRYVFIVCYVFEKKGFGHIP